MSDNTHKVIAASVALCVVAFFTMIILIVANITSEHKAKHQSFACAATEDSYLTDCQSGARLHYDHGVWHVTDK